MYKYVQYAMPVTEKLWKDTFGVYEECKQQYPICKFFAP